MKGNWDGAKEILEDAAHIVQHDRNLKNGNPEDNFAHIALGWTGVLRAKGLLDDDQSLTDADVARMMVVFKMMRDGNSAQRDNRTDAVGYTLCLERVEPTDRG